MINKKNMLFLTIASSIFCIAGYSVPERGGAFPPGNNRTATVKPTVRPSAKPAAKAPEKKEGDRQENLEKQTPRPREPDDSPGKPNA